jgi:5,6-dimethylbenzimidazole synthase
MLMKNAMVLETAAPRDWLYNILASRRSIRADFSSRTIPQSVLDRLSTAVSWAPSVGHSQPVQMIRVSNPEIRRRLFQEAVRCHKCALAAFSKHLADRLRKVPLPEEIVSAPVLFVVACEIPRSRKAVFGAANQPHTHLISAGCAVQNLWIAARAEQIGMRLITTFSQKRAQRVLGLPRLSLPLAIACLGYANSFPMEPEFSRLCINRKDLARSQRDTASKRAKKSTVFNKMRR